MTQAAPMQVESEQDADRPIGHWEMWLLRADPRPLLLIAAIVAFSYMWKYHTPLTAKVGGTYVHDYFDRVYMLVLFAALRWVQRSAQKRCETRLGLPEGAHASRIWFWPPLALIATGTLYAIQCEAPLYVAFHLSRPGLDALADEAIRDPVKAPLLAGRRAGLFRIEGVEVIGRTVLLYIDHEKGMYGFAHIPNTDRPFVQNVPKSEDPKFRFADFPPTHDLRHDPRAERIAGDWFVVFSGYLKIRVGWS